MPKRNRITPFQVYQLLPRTNCKKCGLVGCFAFAAALIGREKTLKDCPDLYTERYQPLLLKLSEYFGEEAEAVEKTGLLINKEKCSGCGDCVIVCSWAFKAGGSAGTPGAIATAEREDELAEVMQIVDGVLVLINCDSCKRCANPPINCRVCEEKCPYGALEMVRLGQG